MKVKKVLDNQKLKNYFFKKWKYRLPTIIRTIVEI